MGELEICRRRISAKLYDHLCGQIHNRMPVILTSKEWSLWLGEDAGEPEQLKPMLRPYPRGRHDDVARERPR
jgi:putative SOS response-associated peptidase YedK